MAALTTDRLTPGATAKRLAPRGRVDRLFAGSLVCLNATGYATGRDQHHAQGGGGCRRAADNSGRQRRDQRRGRARHLAFRQSSGGDLIALADVGSVCYVVDDQTVAKTHNGNTRSVAGTVRDVDAAGVWVEF